MMKNFKKILISAIILACLLITMTLPAYAASKPLDEIQDYTITVNMRPDGTMDIKYHLEWKVLDDSLEGPLEWVKIGNPNKYVDEITALSNNIKNIKYISDGGSFIRIDFKNIYTLAFKICRICLKLAKSYTVIHNRIFVNII